MDTFKANADIYKSTFYRGATIESLLFIAITTRPGYILFTLNKLSKFITFVDTNNEGVIIEMRRINSKLMFKIATLQFSPQQQHRSTNGLSEVLEHNTLIDKFRNSLLKKN
ncbi:hypothetical protein H8356DRAFT_1362536 [Neocallimastix lanati (nom. inval.)]|nr:hypothetical protein H8356DRAFT_1362536 [Neocallimastix sp. JGI-2020a]